MLPMLRNVKTGNGDSPLLLSIDETARILGLRPVTIRAWAMRRKIARCKLGRRTLIPVQEVERLIAQNLIPATPERTPK